jgi:pimeloyl-ACP methyl ester carboxylesterase
MGKRICFLLYYVFQISMNHAQNTDKMMMQYKVNGEGASLVLIPGGLTGWASWDPFVADFSTMYKVVQVQLLNVEYGLENKELPNNYSVRTESEALAKSLIELNISEPTYFIGWSFGSFVLLDFALANPHLVKSMVLIEPPAFWILKQHHRISHETNEIMDFMKSLKGDISEKQLEGFLLSVGFAPPGTSLQNHPQWNIWLKFRQSLRNSGHVVLHDDELDKLKKLDKPIMLLKGTGSASFLHDIMDLLAQDLLNSTIVELPQGHAPHIVSKEQFLYIIKKFHDQE